MDMYRNVSRKVVVAAAGVSVVLWAAAAQAQSYSIAEYLPLKQGNRWTTSCSGSACTAPTHTSTVTVASAVDVATTSYVISGSDGAISTYQIGPSGITHTREYDPSVYVAGYGNTAVTIDLSPPLVMAPASATAGTAYASTGKATLQYAGIGVFILDYTAHSTLHGLETVSVPAGSYSALKVTVVLNVSGTVGGRAVSLTGTTTYWLAKGLGPVRSDQTTADGKSESNQLTSTNVSLCPGGIATATIPLVIGAGWNLLGNGDATTSLDAKATFGTPTQPGAIPGAITAWKWRRDGAGGGNWAFYAATLSDAELASYAAQKGYEVLSQIAPGEGYWVNVTLASQRSTTYCPRALTTSDLTPGWNLIATGASVGPDALNAMLSATPPAQGAAIESFTTLWAWDNSKSRWYFFAPSLHNSGGLSAYASQKVYLDFFAYPQKKLDGVTGAWINR